MKACTVHECQLHGVCYAEANGKPEYCDREKAEPGKVLECANPDCGWKGQSNRMCGSIGPLCPVCDEIAE